MRKLLYLAPLLALAALVGQSSAQTPAQVLSTLGLPQPAHSVLCNSASTTGTYTNCIAGTGITITGGQISSSGGSGGGGTPGGSSGQIQYNNSGSFGGFSLAGDCSLTQPNIICSKSNGTAFGTFAFQNFSTPPVIGITTPNTGWFSNLNVTGTTTFTGITGITQCLQVSSAGILTGAGAACGTPAFSTLTTSTNTTATMTLGTGATLTFSGTGVNNANQINGASLPTSALMVGTNGSNQAQAETIGSATTVCNATGSTAAPTACTAPTLIGVLNGSTCDAQSGSTYTVGSGDENGQVCMTSSSANTVTVSSALAPPTGTIVTIEQSGTGLTTLTASGVTLEGPGTYAWTTLGGQYGYIQLQYQGSNIWYVIAYNPGVAAFTLSGTCTSSSPSGGNTGGTFSMGSAGNCTVIVTAGGAITAKHMFVGTVYDQTQPTIPALKQTAQGTGSATFSIPTAVANSDVMTVELVAE